MFCPNCGKLINENAKFCRYCGVDICDDTKKEEVREQISKQAPVVVPLTPEKTNSTSNKKLFLTLGIVFAVLIVAAVVVITLNSKGKKTTDYMPNTQVDNTGNSTNLPSENKNESAPASNEGNESQKKSQADAAVEAFQQIAVTSCLMIDVDGNDIPEMVYYSATDADKNFPIIAFYENNKVFTYEDGNMYNGNGFAYAPGKNKIMAQTSGSDWRATEYIQMTGSGKLDIMRREITFEYLDEDSEEETWYYNGESYEPDSEIVTNYINGFSDLDWVELSRDNVIYTSVEEAYTRFK